MKKKADIVSKIKLILMFLYNLFPCSSLFFHRWHSQLLGTDIPKFGEPIQNQTIAVGREAVFSCVVDNLQTYKVSLLSGEAFFSMIFMICS